MTCLTARALPFGFLLACLIAAGGCSSRFYADQADRQVYGILTSAQQAEFGVARPFSIDDSPSRNVALTADQILGDLPLAGPLPEWLAESNLAKLKEPLREIDLTTALRLARRNSREFQTNKETLYLSALSLTAQLHAFETQFAFSGDVMRTVQGADRERTLGESADLGIAQRLRTGTLLALDIGLTGLKYINHELATTLESSLNLSVTQPLWRGADRVVVLNNLVQAEHNVVYALRTFARYEKIFAVRVASSYYRVLLQLDRVSNEWGNYQRRIDARKKNELLAEAQRLQPLEVDQARQSELTAHNSYLTAVQDYESQLDLFHMLLGLPTDAPVVLSRKPLEEMAAEGPQAVTIDAEEAIQTALARRLDAKNSRGEIEDADRDVYVAADDLRGDIDFVGRANVKSTPDTRAGRFLFHEGLYEFGLQVDLPLDRLAERNTYRSRLIQFDAAVRSYMDLVDSIKQNIRNSLRQLRRTVETYEIQKAGLELAQRRVAGTSLELDLSRATTRDLLEAQDALVSAQNSLTEALVSHRIARLEFLRDMELLEVDQEGQIHEGSLDHDNGNDNLSAKAGGASR
jgi:outer membrane protein TolC